MFSSRRNTNRMIFRRRMYLDNTATTRTRREVVSAMSKYFGTTYANPSSIHESGLIARGSIEMARERIAGVLGCRSEEIIFAGSGSEANNTALCGVAEANKSRGRHIITSPLEHSSILNTCRALEENGFEVTYLRVNQSGHIDLDHLAHAIRNDTILVSLGYVNNEIGTIQDVGRTVEIVKSRGVLLHFDAVQALPYLDVNMKEIGADLMSFSGHKLYAPKGVGLLYVRSGTPLKPHIHGGMQEFGLRSGTENVPYAVGLSQAILLNAREKEGYVSRLQQLRDKMIRGILQSIPDSMLTGDPVRRAPNHASFCFKGLNGKMLVRELSQFAIEASSGSACSSPRNDPSHVLLACGVPPEYLYGSLRLTLGRYNSHRDVSRLIRILPGVIAGMRTKPASYYNEPIFVSQEDFHNRRKTGNNLLVLDVRPIRYPDRMIPGSLHVPGWRIAKHVRGLRPGTEIVLVCYHGDVISPRIHEDLYRKGFHNVKVLKGGLFGYSAKDD
jgi:cysteine desulfurase